MSPAYFRGAEVIICVFDISSQSSFEDVKKWVEIAKRNSLQQVSLFLVGNKCDLESKVDIKEIMALKNKNKMNYIEVSAKTGHKIEDLFHDVAKVG